MSRTYLVVEKDSKVIHISNIDITGRPVEVMLDAQRYEQGRLEKRYNKRGVIITQHMGQGHFLKGSREEKYLRTHKKVMTIEEILARTPKDVEEHKYC
jgi:hypothetical protein